MQRNAISVSPTAEKSPEIEWKEKKHTYHFHCESAHSIREQNTALVNMCEKVFINKSRQGFM